MAREVKLLDSNNVEEVVILGDAMESLVDNSLVTMTDSDGIFFQRQLEAIETTTYDVLYPDLEARECFTVNSFGGAGVTTLTYRSYDRVGKAQVINARATDLPKSEISGKEYSMSVKSVGVAYDFDIDEVASAAVTGMPLEARRAQASRRGYEEFINDSTWYGNDSYVGFFSHPQLVQQPVAAGVSTNTEWSTKTPDEILADLNAACGTMFATTKKIHKPAQLWLPVLLWNHIASTPRSNVSDTVILEFFLKNNPYITSRDQVKVLNAIEGRGQGGTECFVIMNPKTPEGTETIRMREPLPLQFLPVQLHGLVYEIPGRGRFGGLEVTYPAAIAIYYGI